MKSLNFQMLAVGQVIKEEDVHACSSVEETRQETGRENLLSYQDHSASSTSLSTMYYRCTACGEYFFTEPQFFSHTRLTHCKVLVCQGQDSSAGDDFSSSASAEHSNLQHNHTTACTLTRSKSLRDEHKGTDDQCRQLQACKPVRNTVLTSVSQKTMNRCECAENFEPQTSEGRRHLEPNISLDTVISPLSDNIQRVSLHHPEYITETERHAEQRDAIHLNENVCVRTSKLDTKVRRLENQTLSSKPPFCCYYCSAIFQTKIQFLDHIKIHIGKKTFYFNQVLPQLKNQQHSSSLQSSNEQSSLTEYRQKLETCRENAESRMSVSASQSCSKDIVTGSRNKQSTSNGNRLVNNYNEISESVCEPSHVISVSINPQRLESFSDNEADPFKDKTKNISSDKILSDTPRKTSCPLNLRQTTTDMGESEHLTLKQCQNNALKSPNPIRAEKTMTIKQESEQILNMPCASLAFYCDRVNVDTSNSYENITSAQLYNEAVNETPNGQCLLENSVQHDVDNTIMEDVENACERVVIAELPECSYMARQMSWPMSQDDICNTVHQQLDSSSRETIPVHLDRPYRCHLCRAQFRQNGHLKSHIRTHTGERPYKCRICGLSFTQSGAVRRHELRHRGQKPTICDLCGKQFTHLWNLKCHMKSAHA